MGGISQRGIFRPLTRPKKIFSCIKDEDESEPTRITRCRGRVIAERTHAYTEQRYSSYKLKNPLYFRPASPLPLNMTTEYDGNLMMKQYSKFHWAKRHVPTMHLDKIVTQLRNGNEFSLTYDEWISGDSNDIELFVGYFEEEPRALCRIKVTNTDRRRLIKIWDPDNSRN